MCVRTVRAMQKRPYLDLIEQRLRIEEEKKEKKEKKMIIFYSLRKF